MPDLVGARGFDPLGTKCRIVVPAQVLEMLTTEDIPGAGSASTLGKGRIRTDDLERVNDETFAANQFGCP